MALAGSYTSKGFYKPAEHESGWGDAVNNNFEIIDSSYALLSGTQTFTGPATFNAISARTITLTPTITGRILDADGSTMFGYSASSIYLGYPTRPSNTGFGNTCFGNGCLNNATFSGGETAVGYHALSADLTGTLNTVVGEFSLNALTNGSRNTVVGAQSMLGAISSVANTAIGQGALFTTSQSSNTALGAQSLFYLSTGSLNTGVGFEAGNGTDTLNGVINTATAFGQKNTYLGAYTGQSVSSQIGIEKSVAIGYAAQFDASNQVQVGGTNGSGNEVTLRVSSITVQGTAATIGGKNICLSDGTNCAAGGGSGSSNLQVTQSLVQVTSPTATINFTGAGVSVSASGSTATVTIAGASGASLTSTNTFSGANTFVSTTTMGNAALNGGSGVPYLTINSTGPSYGLLVNQTGRASSGLQNKLGAVTIQNRVPGGFATPLLVLVDSSTDVQDGAGVMEIWVESLTRNDPGIWYHDTSNGSGGQIRIDATGSNGPNFEITGSSDLSHGLSKWEPFAEAGSGGFRLQQPNSRCYDNSGFDNMAYWEPLSKGGGLFLMPYNAVGCEAGSGFSASSTTIAINWTTLNNHTVGIRGPDNTTASWTFRLPSTISNGGQVLYQATSSSPRNWEFTTGGAVSQSLKFTSTSAAPVWGTPTADSLTKAQLGATVPARAGDIYYCSDCTTLRMCVSTGTVQGAFSSPVAATTPCN